MKRVLRTSWPPAGGRCRGSPSPFIPSDHYLFLPDQARPVDPLVEVPGEAEDDDGAASTWSTSSSARRLSPRAAVPRRPGRRRPSSPSTRSPGGRQRPAAPAAEPNQMSRSQRDRRRGRAARARLPGRGARRRRRGGDRPPGQAGRRRARGGDVIVEVERRAVSSPEDLSRAMAESSRAGARDLRSARRRAREVTSRTWPRPTTRAPVVGSSVGSRRLRLPRWTSRSTRATSAGRRPGCAFALDVVDELGQRRRRRPQVAATGELSLDGASRRSAASSRRRSAPAARARTCSSSRTRTAEEARKAVRGDGLKIVPVSTFDEALSVLAAIISCPHSQRFARNLPEIACFSSRQRLPPRRRKPKMVAPGRWQRGGKIPAPTVISAKPGSAR